MPSEVHKRPCKHCPSAHWGPTPESVDIKETWPRPAQLETVFACAWRPTALCRGYVDYLGHVHEQGGTRAKHGDTIFVNSARGFTLLDI